MGIESSKILVLTLKASSAICSRQYIDVNNNIYMWGLLGWIFLENLEISTIDLFCPHNACMETEVQLWRCFFCFCIFLVWWRKEGSKYHYKRAINSPPAKRHLNGVSLVGRWWPNIECWIGSCDFKGIRTSIAKEAYALVIFQGSPCPPLWISTCNGGAENVVCCSPVCCLVTFSVRDDFCLTVWN